MTFAAHSVIPRLCVTCIPGPRLRALERGGGPPYGQDQRYWPQGRAPLRQEPGSSGESLAADFHFCLVFWHAVHAYFKAHILVRGAFFWGEGASTAVNGVRVHLTSRPHHYRHRQSCCFVAGSSRGEAYVLW